MKLVTDTGIVFARELRPVLRSPFSLVFGLVQPVVFLALFSPLLAGTPGLRGESPLQWFVPGVLVMLALFGSSTTGSNLQLEMQTGSHERLLVTPLGRSALLIGRALKELVPTLAQAALVVAVAIPFGFTLHPIGAVIGLMMLAAFSVGLGALSYSLALVTKGQDWAFWVVQQTLLFPLMILSGMLLPVGTEPGWLQTASRANPLTYVVDAERALFAGELLEPAVLYGVVAAVAVAAVGLWVGIRAIRGAAV